MENILAFFDGGGGVAEFQASSPLDAHNAGTKICACGVFSYPLPKNFACKILPLEAQPLLRAALYGFDVHSLSSDKERTKKAD